MISVLSPAEVVTAIQNDRVTTLIRVPGIGWRSAEEDHRRTARPGRGVLAADLDTAAQSGEQISSSVARAGSSGLQGLGWSSKDADAAVEKIARWWPTTRRSSLGRLMKAALQTLARAWRSPHQTHWPGRALRSDEIASESALRPSALDDEANWRVVDQLSLVLQAARHRGSTPDHVLLSGPPGLGKTTLAMIIANEMGVPLHITSGPAIQHAGDLAAILSGLTEGEVLFLDEIHRMSRPAEELLYLAMEDFRVDVGVGKGPGATAIPIEIPPFTLVGATTRAGLLPWALRDRFGFHRPNSTTTIPSIWNGSPAARPS